MALKQQSHWKSNPFVPIVGSLRPDSPSQLAKLGLWGQTIEATEAMEPFFKARESPKGFKLERQVVQPGNDGKSIASDGCVLPLDGERHHLCAIYVS